MNLKDQEYKELQK